MWSGKRKRDYPRTDPFQRWAAKVKKLPVGCWMWVGGKGSHGYGSMMIEKTPAARFETAHRLSWIFHVGEIPNGMQVLHKCDTRLCVNPEHLFLGTQRDNIDDCIAKGRFQYIKGKLTPDQRCEVRKFIALGERDDVIAARFRVSRRAINYYRSQFKAMP